MEAGELFDLGCDSYRNIKRLPDGPYKGHFCHTAQMMFTVGVMISDKDNGSALMRWCYPSYVKAKEACAAFTGVGDPPGEWVKFKGPNGERNRIKGRFDD